TTLTSGRSPRHHARPRPCRGLNVALRPLVNATEPSWLLAPGCTPPRRALGGPASPWCVMGAEPAAPRASRPALLVALGILCSRLAGLARQRVIAHYFGLTTDAA